LYLLFAFFNEISFNVGGIFLFYADVLIIRVRHVQIISILNLMSLKELKRFWEIIKDELEQIPHDYVQEEPRVFGDWLKSDGISRILNKYKSGKHGWIKGWQEGWEQWPIIWDEHVVESNTKYSPLTVNLLKTIPGIRVAAFTRMKPHTQLKQHTDNVGTNYKFTYHLGLKCPEGCNLYHSTLGKTSEENGKHVIFDAKLPHWAENASNEDRVILYIEYYN